MPSPTRKFNDAWRCLHLSAALLDLNDQTVEQFIQDDIQATKEEQIALGKRRVIGQTKTTQPKGQVRTAASQCRIEPADRQRHVAGWNDQDDDKAQYKAFRARVDRGAIPAFSMLAWGVATQAYAVRGRWFSPWADPSVADREDVEKRARACGQALVAAGCDVNATDERGYTALHLAARFCERDFAEFLIHSGADVSARTTVSNVTPRSVVPTWCGSVYTLLSRASRQKDQQ